VEDVGKPKAEVAAKRVMERVSGVNIVPHFCRIEDKEIPFYNDFNIIVLGLDSIEARSYINSVACSFLGAYFISLFLFMIRFGVKLTVSFLLFFLVLNLIYIDYRLLHLAFFFSMHCFNL
jgi:molybdopterin/thiamine biosynthesis adenylyltransferase